MSIRKLSKNHLKLASILLFAGVMTYFLFNAFAATGTATLYSSPSGTQNVAAGKTFNLSVRIKTGSNVPVTGASVYLSYPTDKLQVVSESYAGSPYTTGLVTSNSGGILRMDRAAFPAISGGDQLFAVVTFKAIAAGSAPISFTSKSIVTSGEDDSNILAQRNGTNYNISAASTKTVSSSSISPGSSSSSSSTGSTTTTNSESSSSSSSASADDTSTSSSDPNPAPSTSVSSKDSKRKGASKSAEPSSSSAEPSFSSEAQNQTAKVNKTNPLIWILPVAAIFSIAAFIFFVKPFLASHFYQTKPLAQPPQLPQPVVSTPSSVHMPHMPGSTVTPDTHSAKTPTANPQPSNSPGVANHTDISAKPPAG